MPCIQMDRYIETGSHLKLYRQRISFRLTYEFVGTEQSALKNKTKSYHMCFVLFHPKNNYKAYI